MLTVRNISFEDNIDWEGLFAGSNTATFFQTKEWLELWMKYWGKTGKAVIYAVFDNDELIGIAPFYQTSDKINILSVPDPSIDGSLSDFGDLIIKSGREKEVWEVVIDVILGTSKARTPESIISNDSGQARMTKVLKLNYIREESPSFKILQDLGGRVEEMEVSPCMDLPKTWDEYLSTLDRHDRHEIRRKMRKAEDAGVIKVCDEINNQNINDFFQLMIASDENKRNFLSENMKKFFSEMIMLLGPKKLLTLCFLRYNNANIASILLMYQKNEVLLYNSGFNPKYSFLSPGLILNAYVIRGAIETGKDRFDFLRGNEKYKYDLGGVKRKLFKISF